MKPLELILGPFIPQLIPLFLRSVPRADLEKLEALPAHGISIAVSTWPAGVLKQIRKSRVAELAEVQSLVSWGRENPKGMTAAQQMDTEEALWAACREPVTKAERGEFERDLPPRIKAPPAEKKTAAGREGTEGTTGSRSESQDKAATGTEGGTSMEL